MKMQNIRTVFKTDLTLLGVYRVKDKIYLKIGCVYAVTCRISYIGEVGKLLATCISKRTRTINNNWHKSAFTKHLRNTYNQFDSWWWKSYLGPLLPFCFTNELFEKRSRLINTPPISNVKMVSHDLKRGIIFLIRSRTAQNTWHIRMHLENWYGA